MNTEEIYDIKDLVDLLTPIFKQYEIQRASVFGSYAKLEATENSDVNLLVELDESFGLKKFDALHDDIEKTLKKSVDILEYDSVVDLMQPEILQKAVQIYEKG